MDYTKGRKGLLAQFIALDDKRIEQVKALDEEFKKSNRYEGEIGELLKRFIDEQSKRDKFLSDPLESWGELSRKAYDAIGNGDLETVIEIYDKLLVSCDWGDRIDLTDCYEYIHRAMERGHPDMVDFFLRKQKEWDDEDELKDNISSLLDYMEIKKKDYPNKDKTLEVVYKVLTEITGLSISEQKIVNKFDILDDYCTSDMDFAGICYAAKLTEREIESVIGSSRIIQYILDNTQINIDAGCTEGFSTKNLLFAKAVLESEGKLNDDCGRIRDFKNEIEEMTREKTYEDENFASLVNLMSGISVK